MKIAVIPDTHFPYCDLNKLEKAYPIIKRFQPDVIVQVGDLYDQVSFSNYPKDPSKTVYSPKEEAVVGRKQAANMWARLRKDNPRARLIQLPGNHDARLVKKLTTNFPEAAFIGESFMEGQFMFAGVEVVEDEFVIDDIMFMHGMRPMGQHAKWNQMNTVTGHTHQARVEYFMNREGIYWEFNVGWIGDKDSYPFAYRVQRKLDNTHQGIGLIEDGNPRFVLI